MNIQPVDQQSQQINDDQELAKVLAGVNAQDDDADDAALPTPSTPPEPTGDTPSDSVAPELPPMPEPVTPAPTEPASFDPVTPADPTAAPASVDPELDRIKQQALGELRPLVDKLDVSPDEKFDTYLLLLRSTDDRALIAPAHEAARNIPDEARRAQALLDVIKEIDFLSQPQS